MELFLARFATALIFSAKACLVAGFGIQGSMGALEFYRENARLVAEQAARRATMGA